MALRTRTGVLLLLVGFCIRATAAPSLIDTSLALEFAGEMARSGSCEVGLVPAPGEPEGVYSLRLRFRLREHRPADWLDAAATPAPPRDFGDTAQRTLWIRAEQPSDFLHIKIVDPSNPGPNSAALEETVAWKNGPLPAKRWVNVDLPLPQQKARRDSIRSVGFYIPASNTNVPLNTDLVFYAGKFPYELPERPPWPPAPASRRVTTETVFDAPLAAGGPWMRVGGDDNQNDHLAVFRNGGVEFDSTADGWNEFLWSEPEKLRLEPEHTYRIQFDYEILRPARGDNAAYFYSLVRAKGTIREDVGWQRWDDPAGTEGRRTVVFTTRDVPDYYVIFGIRHRGAIRIDSVAVDELQPGDVK